MAERVLLYAGTPKSGTTFLQSLLWTNRDRLAESGVLLPGERPHDHNRLGQALRSWTPQAGRRNERHWRSTVEAAAVWPGTVVFGNEWMVRADIEQLRQAIRELAPATVEIVLTARDPVALAPAAWQESLKVGRSTSLGNFLKALDAAGTQWSWQHVDAAEVLHRWDGALPTGQCSVVTLPPRGAYPSVLWHRFAEVLGVDPAGYELGGIGANQSLSAEAAALLQRVGPSLREAVDADGGGWLVQYRWIRQYVGHELLMPLGGRPIGLRSGDVRRLRERTGSSVARLREGGYRIVGDLADLESETVPPGAVHPDDVSDSEVLEVAAAVLPQLLARVRELTLAADG